MRSPFRQVVTVEAKAEQIGRYKARLRGLQADHANDYAIRAGNDPALPQTAANQNRGDNGEHARDVIQPEHSFQVYRE